MTSSIAIRFSQRLKSFPPIHSRLFCEIMQFDNTRFDALIGFRILAAACDRDFLLSTCGFPLVMGFLVSSIRPKHPRKPGVSMRMYFLSQSPIL